MNFRGPIVVEAVSHPVEVMALTFDRPTMNSFPS